VCKKLAAAGTAQRAVGCEVYNTTVREGFCVELPGLAIGGGPFSNLD
jgi:hypothetical protein